MGEIAVEKPAEDNIINGILLKKNFSYHIFASEDIPSKFIKCILNNLYLNSMFPFFSRILRHVIK